MARTKKTGLKEKAPAGAPPQKQATLFDSFQEGRPRKAAVVGVRPASETEEDDDYDPVSDQLQLKLMQHVTILHVKINLPPPTCVCTV